VTKLDIRHLCKRVGKKDWNSLLSIWVNFLPEIDFPIIEEPEPTSSIEKLKTIRTEIEEIEHKTTKKEHYFVIQGAHNLVFQESIYLFYKALNVLRSTQCELEGGFKTWSISNAYQSSYFTLKSILNLLGVHITRIDSKDLLIDLLPDYKGGFSKKEIANRRLDFECQVQITKQLEHWELWTLLQRVLHVLQCSLIKGKVITFLCGVSAKDFAKQRNRIIYYNTAWLFDDLKQSITDANFGIRKIDFDDKLSSDDDFSLIISFILLKTCYDLLKNIAEVSTRLQIEMEVIDQIIFRDDNNRYNGFVSLQELTS
jgi:hypothetical protein